MYLHRNLQIAGKINFLILVTLQLLIALYLASDVSKDQPFFRINIGLVNFLIYWLSQIIPMVIILFFKPKKIIFTTFCVAMLSYLCLFAACLFNNDLSRDSGLLWVVLYFPSIICATILFIGWLLLSNYHPRIKYLPLRLLYLFLCLLFIISLFVILLAVNFSILLF